MTRKLRTVRGKGGRFVLKKPPDLRAINRAWSVRFPPCWRHESDAFRHGSELDGIAPSNRWCSAAWQETPLHNADNYGGQLHLLQQARRAVQCDCVLMTKVIVLDGHVTIFG